MARQHGLVLLLAVLGFLAALARAVPSPPANSTCWNPDAKFEVTGDRPCGDPKDGHSACCTDGAYCMAGGLCFDGWAVYRSSCTDPTWQDPACATTCRNVGNPGAASMLSALHVVPNVFCCGLLGETNGTCLDSNGHEAPDGFSLDFPPTITAFANASYANLSPWLNTTAAPAAPAATVTAPAAGPADPTAAPGPSAAAVGAAVGTPLGVALLAALAAVLALQRRIRVLRAQLGGAAALAGHPQTHTQAHGLGLGLGFGAADEKRAMVWDGATWVPAPPPVPPKGVAEMSGFDRGRELAAGWVGQELPGNGVDGKFHRIT